MGLSPEWDDRALATLTAALEGEPMREPSAVVCEAPASVRATEHGLIGVDKQPWIDMPDGLLPTSAVMAARYRRGAPRVTPSSVVPAAVALSLTPRSSATARALARTEAAYARRPTPAQPAEGGTLTPAPAALAVSEASGSATSPTSPSVPNAVPALRRPMVPLRRTARPAMF